MKDSGSQSFATRPHVTGLSNASNTRHSYNVADRKYFRDAMSSRRLGFGGLMMERVTGPSALGQGSSTRINLVEKRGVHDVTGVNGVERLAAFATARKVPLRVFLGLRESTALAGLHEQERDALVLGLATSDFKRSTSSLISSCRT